MRRLSALTLMLIWAFSFASMAEPVENRRPNTDLLPAFGGQTRAPGVVTEGGFEFEILTRDLDSPWAVVPLPDGRLLVTEKAGTMRIYDFQSGLGPPIGGFPPVAGGQGGLLDAAPAPDFTYSRTLYFTFAEQTEKGSATALGRARLAPDETTITGHEVLWRALPYFPVEAHYGSRLAFGPDGTIYVSTGDRQSGQTRPLAQELYSAYGKVVRLTPDGNPAPGNPFEKTAGALPEIWSLGHRNVQGLAFDPATGGLYISEMGPRGGDEINVIEPGRNYGWPVVSYGEEYTGRPVGEGIAQAPGMEQPTYYWDPVIAPSGIAFYEGEMFPEWEGSLFVGGLAGSHIARLHIENRRVTGEERLLEGEGERFRDVAFGPDGALFAVTDSGRLYRIFR